jgi:Tfp pilus assembly protein PilN
MAAEINLLVDDPRGSGASLWWRNTLVGLFAVAAVCLLVSGWSQQHHARVLQTEGAQLQKQAALVSRPTQSRLAPGGGGRTTASGASTQRVPPASRMGGLYGRLMTALSGVSVEQLSWTPTETTITGSATDLTRVADAMDGLEKLPGVTSVQLTSASRGASGAVITFDIAIGWEVSS